MYKFQKIGKPNQYRINSASKGHAKFLIKLSVLSNKSDLSMYDTKLHRYYTSMDEHGKSSTSQNQGRT
jgi:hypothetical protein